MPIVVEFSQEKWSQVIACMSYAPARESMALMNEIGQQVAQQLAAKHQASNPPNIAMPSEARGNSQESPS